MSVQFGVCPPIFAAPGNVEFRVPNWAEVSAPAVKQMAQRAEELGYDSLWVADHLMLGEGEAILEGWTTLSVLAGVTESIRLGLIHQSNAMRHPPLAAKMAATLDQLSGGRLIHFFDVGNNEREHRAYGFLWEEELAERVAMMEEALTLMVQLWTADEPLTVRGTYYHVEGAVCRPKPHQQPHPPIWIGETRGGLLDVCARHAQGWNSVPVGLEEWKLRRSALAEACQRHGRDIEEIECSYETQILIAPDLPSLRAQVGHMLSLNPKRAKPEWVDYAEGRAKMLPASLTDRFLVGTPDQIREQVAAYVESGVDHFLLWFMDAPREEGLALFAEEVMKPLRASA